MISGGGEVRQRRADKGAFDGRLYVIGSVADRRVKIGTSRDPEGRLAELQIGNPHPLRILITFAGGGALERLVHDRLHRFRACGEWFDFGEANPVIMVEDAIRNLRESGFFPSEEELEALLLAPKEPTVKERILAALKAHESPMTLDQLAVSIGIIGSRLSPRLTALKRKGHVTNSGGLWSLANEKEE
ncbi:GIY-YIG nuclease family protein [Streptomyces antimycoticus]